MVIHVTLVKIIQSELKWWALPSLEPCTAEKNNVFQEKKIIMSLCVCVFEEFM